MPESTGSERMLPFLLLTLTGVTGLVDAVSYIGLGRVFTANMTGNVVLLAFAAAGVPGLSVPRSLTALIGFFIGAVIGGRIAAGFGASARQRWIAAAFVMEAVLLIAAAVVSIGYRIGVSESSARLYAIIVLTAFAMGIRNAAVRKLGVADLTTTVLTLTITGLAADSSLAGGSNPNLLRRLGSVVMMFGGAVLGALMLRSSVLLPLAVCSVVAGTCAAVVVLQFTESAQIAPPGKAGKTP